ncbi:MAG TPA: hypothetical protein DCS63_09985 [Elusimicrobia bacterium]|nr:hypothetical protein [Elusimicrobiota bacterium]
MTRNLAIIAVLAACAATLAAFRPPEQRGSVKAAWMTILSPKTGGEYYLELAQDGRAIMREETRKRLLTRRGIVKPQLVRDFFREIDNSEIINSQSVKRSRMVAYDGDVLRISAYVSGELARTEAPLGDFGEAFAHAFGEVKKAAAALPPETALSAFLCAEPLKGEALDAFRGEIAVDGEIKYIETEDISRIKPLMAAIKEPHRLVPLETEAEVRELQDFVTAMRLYGLRALFYLPSTRGTFKCRVIDAARSRPGGKRPAARGAGRAGYRRP